MLPATDKHLAENVLTQNKRQERNKNMQIIVSLAENHSKLYVFRKETNTHKYTRQTDGERQPKRDIKKRVEKTFSLQSTM